MKLINDTLVQSNLDAANSGLMSFDDEGIGHIMSLLSNMYADAPQSVLREYAANAKDSHIAAGVDRPVEITLPDAFNPNLIIQDFGLGLGLDELINVFARYGKSTKRDSDTQVGAFGIGAKSGFTIGGQFVVVGVKDGMETCVLFALNEEGAGTTNIMYSRPTDKENGVTVSIAVDKFDDVRAAANHVFSTWESGSVLVDGQPVECVFDRAEEIAPGIWYDRANSRDTISMGGVNYPIPSLLVEGIKGGGYRLVFQVDIGAVDITPSRENLRDTPRTKAVIKRLYQEYAVAMENITRTAIDAAPTAWEARFIAINVYSKFGMNKSMNGRGATWRGVNLLLDVNRTVILDYICKKSNGLAKMTDKIFDIGKWAAASIPFDRQIVVVSDDINKVGRYARRFFRVNADLERIFVASEPNYRQDWFGWGEGSPLKVYNSLDEFKEEYKRLAEADKAILAELADSSESIKEEDIEYTVYHLEDEGVGSVMLSVADLREYSSGKIYWVKGDLPHHLIQGDSLFNPLVEGDLLIELKNQRETTLERRVPGVISFTETRKTLAREYLDGLSPEVAESVVFVSNHEMESFEGFMQKYDCWIDSPPLNRYIEARKLHESQDHDARNAITTARQLLMLPASNLNNHRETLQQLREDLAERFPMLIMADRYLLAANRYDGWSSIYHEPTQQNNIIAAYINERKANR